MVLSNDPMLLDQVRCLRSHGMTSLTLDRYRGHACSYDVTILGYNYRMDELRAAIGLVQLPQLQQWNKKRSQLSYAYRQIISTHIPEVVIPFIQDHETAAHLMPIILPAGVNRQKVMNRLREAGIQSSIHYPPIHLFSYYRERFPGVTLPKTEKFCDRELTLPLHPSLTENDIERVVESLQKAIKGARF